MLRNRTVRPLEEDLAEIGLDPKKTIDAIHETSRRVDARMGGASGGGAPSYVRQPAGKRPVTEDKDQPAKPAEQPATAAGGEPVEEAVELSEAMRVMRTRRLTSSEKSKGRRARRKRKAAIKAYGRKYRSRFKRKIKRRAAMKMRRYGTAGLERLHKSRKRIVMHADTELANLREELNQSAPVANDTMNPYEEAALNSGLLAMLLGEMFEACGDTESAETMFDLSDIASDLSESFETLSEDTLDEEQEGQLQQVLDAMVKGLKIYEALGMPSLIEILEFAEANGNGKAKAKSDGGDEEEEGEGEGEGEAA